MKENSLASDHRRKPLAVAVRTWGSRFKRNECGRVKSSEQKQQRVRNAILITIAFGAAAVDAWSFYAFGEVFTGIMTGNIVLVGANLVQGDVAHVTRSLVAFAFYAAGCALGAAICGNKPDGAIWTARVTRCLLLEFACLCLLGIVWQFIRGARSERELYVAIALGGFSMGLQTLATLTVGVRDVMTTYVTGMTTAFVRRLVFQSPLSQMWLSPAVILAVICGAACSAFLLARAAPYVPLVPIAACAIAVAAATIWLHD